MLAVLGYIMFTHSKGERVKNTPFAEESKEKERDNGHNTGYCCVLSWWCSAELDYIVLYWV